MALVKWISLSLQPSSLSDILVSSLAKSSTMSDIHRIVCAITDNTDIDTNTNTNTSTSITEVCILLRDWYLSQPVDIPMPDTFSSQVCNLLHTMARLCSSNSLSYFVLHSHMQSIVSRLDNSAFVHEPYYCHSYKDKQEITQSNRVHVFSKNEDKYTVSSLRESILSVFLALHPDTIVGSDTQQCSFTDLFLSSLRSASSFVQISDCITALLINLSTRSIVLRHEEWDLFLSSMQYSLSSLQEAHLAPFISLLTDTTPSLAIKADLCLTQKDINEAKAYHSNITYGEILPVGLYRALDAFHCSARDTGVSSIIDLGMGRGQLLLQCFLDPTLGNVKSITGVEICRGRYEMGVHACIQLCESYPERYKVVAHERIDFRKLRIVVEDDRGRKLELRKQDIFAYGVSVGIAKADIVICSTHFDGSMQGKLRKLFHGMQLGAKLVTLESISALYGDGASSTGSPFKTVPINESLKDKFATSWNPVRGHHLYLSERV